ncbi:putative alkaline shock family protein YloU [Deinobacterium chartae]|uniref:Putative alkaline shock family protein YloU n=1 Tax=Deinobacterium chartae TaxID=521158 RepID=A0A841HZC5_9DEIO|nr:Asp23/Gls24 family envelope stress response protein [Deinobacterium chartae]MBB6098014.1 putative alkaline shock family protein YloU [Deinobacterium chartae]
MKGNITITEAALASLIGLAAHEVPGVVGMAPANLKEGLQKILGRNQARDGVVIHRNADGTYTADLYVVMAYGVNIPTVAENVAERVENAVKTAAGLTISKTTVHAVGVSHA